MNRSRLASAGVAVLAILALAVGAAVIDAPANTQGSGGGTDGDSGGFLGSGSSFSLGGSPPSPTAGEFPTELLQAILIVVGVVALVLLVLLWDEFSLADLRRVAVGAVVLAALLAVGYLVFRLLGGGGRGGGNEAGTTPDPLSLLGGGTGGAADTALQPATTTLPVTALAVGAVVLVGLAVVLRSGDDEPTGDEPDSADATAATEIARAAGRAADRIDDDAAPENEIYRAWREMTRHLDVARPESSTPGEFARAATEAGMDGRDVDELTELFTRVRYDDGRITDERERRAVAALRRIEGSDTEEP